MFPSYVLANLYVKNSLQNIPHGFQIKLKNVIDSGTIIGIGPLTVNENSYSPDKITLKIKDQTVRAEQITSNKPLPVYVLSEIILQVESAPLPAGVYKIGFLINTQEAGRLQFTATDQITE